MPKVLVVATSRKTKGGITSVVKAHETGEQWKKFHCKWIETHRDGNSVRKLWYLATALIEYICLLPFYDIVHIHVGLRTSVNRKLIFARIALLFRKKIIVHFHPATITLLWYFVLGFGEKSGNNMYGWNYFKWCYYFLFMLLGSMMGLKRNLNKKTYPFFEGLYDKHIHIIPIFLKLLICIVLFFGLCWFKCQTGIGWELLQISSLIPLLGTTYYFWRLSNTKLLTQAYHHHLTGPIIRFISGLCLEIYLVQYNLFTDKLNNIFPLNLLVIFSTILVTAYLLRCLSRIWSQTFKDGDYDWRAVTKLYS